MFSLRKALSSDATRVVAYFVATFVLAAIISPWLFRLGKGFAAASDGRETNAFIEWLSASAANADFARYFKRAIALSGLLLLIPLVMSLRMSARRRLDDGPWTRHLPKKAARYADGQPLRKNPHKWLHLLVGFLISGVILLGGALLALQLGYYEWESTPNWPKALRKAVIPAVFASSFEELMFRGALLGVFIRAIGLYRGVVILAAVFAVVHFFVPSNVPPTSSPEAANAGFRHLVTIARGLASPDHFGAMFSLFIIGLVLSHARIATASLWLPIGLHAGWIFSFKLFHRMTDPVAADWLCSGDLRSGFLPTACILITWAVTWAFLHFAYPAKQEVET